MTKSWISSQWLPVTVTWMRISQQSFASLTVYQINLCLDYFYQLPPPQMLESFELGQHTSYSSWPHISTPASHGHFPDSPPASWQDGDCYRSHTRGNFWLCYCGNKFSGKDTHLVCNTDLGFDQCKGEGTAFHLLEGLKSPLFESLLGVSINPLSVKVVLLLALASAKLVIGIHALWVSPACAQFALENILMVLKPNPLFVPKGVGSCSALGLAAFAFPGEQLAHMLHSVLAVCSCVDRTQSIRRSNQLFVFRAESCKGQSVTKSRLTHWVVEAIALVYVGRVLLFRGVSVQAICSDVSWSSPLTLFGSTCLTF